MSTHTMSAARPAVPQRILHGLLWLLASAGSAAVWTLVAVAVDRQCAWMAAITALDVALVLRFTGLPRPGPLRAAWTVAGTLVAIALANWWIAAAQVGEMVGLLPWDSLMRLGWSYAQTLVSLANDGTDLVWYAVAIVVAVIAGR